MGHRQNGFWFPLARLGVFFAGVVVAGNVVLHAFRPEVADRTSTQDQSVDYFAKKKKRLERQFYRTMEKFLGAPAVAPVKEKVSALEPAPVAAAEPAPAPQPLPDTATASLVPPPLPAPTHAVTLAYLAPEALPFSWPEPLPPFSSSRGLDLPASVSLLEEAAFRAELVSDLYRRTERDSVSDIGDAILRVPELLIDGVFTCSRGMASRPVTRSWDDDAQSSMLSQIMDVQIGPRKERIFSEFVRQFAEREAKYVATFEESRANTAGYANGTQELDMHEVLLDQRKVFWDALRRTYVSRYKLQADEKIRDEAWYLDRWSGADFVILPPLLGAYVFYRGFDKRFSVAGTKLLLSIEPVSEWYRPRDRDLPAAIALEWTMKDFPLGVIVSAGMHDRRYGMDFVGIGTSLGAVRQALVMQEDHRPR